MIMVRLIYLNFKKNWKRFLSDINYAHLIYDSKEDVLEN